MSQLIRPTGAESRTSRPGTPLALLLLGFPLWWALGIQMPMYAMTAAWVSVWMLRNRSNLGIPTGFGIWFVFISWVFMSGLMITGPRFAFAWGLRAVLYLSVAVLGLYAYNVVRGGLDPEKITRWLTWLFAYAIILAVPGLLLPSLGFTSPLGYLLRAAGLNDPYIVALVNPRFSNPDPLYGVTRPSPLFEFTNIWGGAIGVLFPVAVYTLTRTRTTGGRLAMTALLVLSVWPIVVSVNRGCWISIGLATAYVVFRRTLALDMRAAATTLALIVAALAAVLFTPLDSIVTGRLDVANTSTRANLYTASLQVAHESPIFGHGAPTSSANVADNNNVNVGTHGQFWTVLVSQGYVGVALFVLALFSLWWYARPANGRSPEVWLHAIGPVVAFQMLVYDVIPLPLLVVFLANVVIGARNRALLEPDGRSTRPTAATRGMTRVPLHS